MKLKLIEKLIHSDVKIIDHTLNKTYSDVELATLDEHMLSREVIGIRADNGYILINVR